MEKNIFIIEMRVLMPTINYFNFEIFKVPISKVFGHPETTHLASLLFQNS